MSRWPILLLVLALVALALGTIWFYEQESKQAFREAELDLQAIAGLKSGQLSAWRRERLGDAAVVSENPIVLRALLGFLDGGSPASTRETTAFFRSLSRRYNYTDVLLVDRKGRVILALESKADTVLHEEARASLREAERTGEATLSRLHGDSGESNHLAVVAPLHRQDGGRMAGAIILRSDAKRFLYPILDSWPVPRASAETLLVRVESGGVLFLNPVRHAAAAPLSMRIPLTEEMVPAVMAARGVRGVVRGLDYRSEPVLAALAAVPDSPWLMVAKVDEKEALGEWHRRARAILSFAGLLAFALLAGMGAFLLMRERTHLMKELELERGWQTTRESLEYAQRAAHLGSWEYDASTGLVVLSAELRRLAGLERGEDLPAWDELVARVNVEDRELVDRARRAIVEGRETVSIEFRATPLREADSGERHFVARVQALRDDAGRLAGAVGSIQDITESLSAEEELLIAKRCIDKAAFAVFRVDDDGTIHMANEKACRSLGYTRGELLGMSIVQIDPNFTLESFREHRKIVADRGSRRIESTHRRKDGTEFPVEVTVTRDRFRDAEHSFSFVRDLSEQRETEKEKAALQAQLLQSQKMEAVGRLAGGVAHDFNNMLQTIQGTAEMALLELDERDPKAESFRHIRQAAERSADLTRQLLAFARRQTVDPRIIDLNDSIAGLLRMLRRLLGESIDVAWHPGRALWPIRMDASQLDQVLANLAVNARDAIFGEGSITIETENVTLDEEYCRTHVGYLAGDYVCLSVSDNGEGMSQETLEHIFEPFFTTKASGTGTGLGLSTVYGIVKQNQGFINVYSEPHEGTVFKIYLPRTVGALPKLEKAREDPLPRGIETVLVAEDDPAILRISQRMLEELGYEVLAGSSGHAALELLDAHQERVHLLLTDVVMHDMNGKQLHQEAIERCPAIKTMYMSGYTANVIAHHGVLDEGIHFIQKPFSIRQLAEAVRGALDDTRGA